MTHNRTTFVATPFYIDFIDSSLADGNFGDVFYVFSATDKHLKENLTEWDIPKVIIKKNIYSISIFITDVFER